MGAVGEQGRCRQSDTEGKQRRDRSLSLHLLPCSLSHALAWLSGPRDAYPCSAQEASRYSRTQGTERLSAGREGSKDMARKEFPVPSLPRQVLLAPIPEAEDSSAPLAPQSSPLGWIPWLRAPSCPLLLPHPWGLL